MTDPEKDGQVQQVVAEDTQFVFEDWAKISGLGRKATGLLRAEECTDKRTLALLEQADVQKFELPLGQKKLLWSEVSRLRDPQPTTAPVTETEREVAANNVISDIQRQAPQLAQAGKDYDQMFHLTNMGQKAPEAGKQTSHPAVDSSYVPAPFDPRAILTVKATRAKATHVTQILPEAVKKRLQGRKRDFVLSSSGDTEGNLVLRTDDNHPYAGLSTSEWSAANCRVLNYMLANGNLRRDHVEYYLAYSTVIYEFMDKYEWSSILEFDYQYREMQAEHGHQWGTLAPHLQLHVLVPIGSAIGSRESSRNRRQHQQVDGNQVDCMQFKVKGWCTFGDSCKYTHAQPRPHMSRAPANVHVRPQQQGPRDHHFPPPHPSKN